MERIDVVTVTSRSVYRRASNLAVLSGGRDHDAVGNAPRARIIRVGSARDATLRTRRFELSVWHLANPPYDSVHVGVAHDPFVAALAKGSVCAARPQQ